MLGLSFEIWSSLIQIPLLPMRTSAEASWAMASAELLKWGKILLYTVYIYIKDIIIWKWKSISSVVVIMKDNHEANVRFIMAARELVKLSILVCCTKNNWIKIYNSKTFYYKKTKTINWLGFSIHVDPTPLIFVQNQRKGYVSRKKLNYHNSRFKCHVFFKKKIFFKLCEKGKFRERLALDD